MENQVSEIIQGSQPENDVADNFKLVIRGDQKKIWTQKEWNIIEGAIQKLIETGFLKPEDIKITDFYFAGSEIKSNPSTRCCGRCDCLNDECVSDMICEKHFQQGCEICFGER
ncbi:hypothetical protein [Cyclobacterium marinum]|uniref:Uncharacterized protein n=1 Tax=Cyclobacterium marinum (strain ATCC 25205 / DSM 745 / LMG 13164 / NCIMB 1802) TaxID=880070 RepID=G0J1Z7_CYCMS|nr:hypothetical protein [Cyclobacterium marinum]AEL24003.1 hypothetical protein Cycma_0221 [Cyclobacterium marinum DSM 745]